MPTSKCDICGLRVIFDQSNIKSNESIESFFKQVRALQSSKIIPTGFDRQIFIGPEKDSSVICAINSGAWMKDKKCRHWQPDIKLSKGEFIQIYLSKQSNNLSKIMCFIALFTAITALPVCYKLYLKIAALVSSFSRC